MQLKTRRENSKYKGERKHARSQEQSLMMKQRREWSLDNLSNTQSANKMESFLQQRTWMVSSRNSGRSTFLSTNMKSPMTDNSMSHMEPFYVTNDQAKWNQTEQDSLWEETRSNIWITVTP